MNYNLEVNEKSVSGNNVKLNQLVNHKVFGKGIVTYIEDRRQPITHIDENGELKISNSGYDDIVTIEFENDEKPSRRFVDTALKNSDWFIREED